MKEKETFFFSLKYKICHHPPSKTLSFMLRFDISSLILFSEIPIVLSEKSVWAEYVQIRQVEEAIL